MHSLSFLFVAAFKLSPAVVTVRLAKNVHVSRLHRFACTGPGREAFVLARLVGTKYVAETQPYFLPTKDV